MTTSPTMTEIDDDVMEKAKNALSLAYDVPGQRFNECVMPVASAIQAARNEERERCAKIVDDFIPVVIVENWDDDINHDVTEYRLDLATAIREGK